MPLSSPRNTPQHVAPLTAPMERRLLVLQEAFADIASLDIEAVLERARIAAASLFLNGQLHLASAEFNVTTPWARRGRFEHEGLGPVIRAWFPGPPTSFWLLLTFDGIYDEVEFRLGSLFLELLCSACQSAGFRAEFEHQARTDWLTGLPNRRAFERAALVTENQKMWLGLFDLDNLKEVNDTRGHAAGDALLVAFVNVLREALPLGRIFRTGGDEFAVFASATERERLMHLLQNASVFASCGWTGPSSEPLPDRLRRADTRMYAHKRLRKGFRKLDNALTPPPTQSQTPLMLPLEERTPQR